MTANERLDLLFERNSGILKTAQVLENGISKSTFYAYAKQHGVKQRPSQILCKPPKQGVK